MGLKILFEDKDILIIDKPAGLIVNESLNCIQDNLAIYLKSNFDWLKHQNWPVDYEKFIPHDYPIQYGKAEDIFLQRSGIVHRLDKDTSGVLIIAKHPGSLLNLLQQFQNRQVKKIYLSLVHGKILEEEGLWLTNIIRHQKKRCQFLAQKQSTSGREAITHYRVQKILRFDVERRMIWLKEKKIKSKDLKKIYQDFSLVEFYPQTGRTHQIRAQGQFFHHALVGDSVYASKKQINLDYCWCPRQFLHSSQISFFHPRLQKKVIIKSQLPKELKEALKFLI